MAIDCHAHYVPRALIDTLAGRAKEFGISVVDTPPSCAIHFDTGLKLRPFFPHLIEEIELRLAGMDKQGVDRQVLSAWADIFAYGLSRERAIKWHRLLNESLSRVAAANGERFSMLASVPLPDAAAAARELAFAAKELGAVGAIVAANVEGTNLGELPLDEFWAAAVEHDLPVFIHPTQPKPVARTSKFALNPIVQYTYDTTLCVGSLIFAGVLDRFPNLRVMLSHGGGTFPYLAGRFDCMHARMDRAAQGNVAESAPSTYLKRFHYDTILHDPRALRWLVEMVGIERVVLGSDYSFPPADHDPIGSVRKAGFTRKAADRILELNARELFPLLPA